MMGCAGSTSISAHAAESSLSAVLARREELRATMGDVQARMAVLAKGGVPVPAEVTAAQLEAAGPSAGSIAEHVQGLVAARLDAVGETLVGFRDCDRRLERAEGGGVAARDVQPLADLGGQIGLVGIAVPVAIVSGVSSAAKAGVLVKGGRALEALARVRVLVIDKTGTLTQGRPELTDLIPAPGFAPDEVLGLVAAIESRSEHPVAEALVAAAKHRGLELADVDGDEPGPVRVVQTLEEPAPYVVLLLLFLFNPLIDSMRALQRVADLDEVQKKLGIRRFSLGSFSESCRVFEPQKLRAVIDQLASRLHPVGRRSTALCPDGDEPAELGGRGTRR